MYPLEIKPNVFWAGVIDWTLRDFHGYSTERGSTYNAYIAKGTEKSVLFDTAKATYTDELLRRVREIVEPEKIDYIVVNHAEMDHTGSLPAMVEAIRPEKIFMSKPCHEAVEAHFGPRDWPVQIVSTGDELPLGGKTVSFIEARMLHWPDSMFSYIKEDRLFVTSDGFGQHYATSERFDDEVDFGEAMRQAAKYYANILLPYSPMMVKALDLIEKLKLDIDIIAPDHGVIWRSHVSDIIAAYRRWATGFAKRKAVVVFDTMWQSTAKMAAHIVEGLISEGVHTTSMDLHVSHHSDVITELLEAKGLVLGSPTLNNGYLPRMADTLCYVKGLRPAGKVGAAFGSYGWGGESLKLLNAELEAMKVAVVHPGIRVKYVPRAEDLARCFEMGRTIGRAIVESTPE